MSSDIVVICIVVILAFGAGFYLYRRKKMEGVCFFCPYAKVCSKNCDKKENEATKKGTSFFCIVLLKSDLAVGMREAGE